MSEVSSQPLPETSTVELSFPWTHVLLITLSRPKALNVLTAQMEEEIGQVMSWFDKEPAMRVAIITGAGSAFCAGGDIKPALKEVLAGMAPSATNFYGRTSHGFGSLSRRNETYKPIIAAVNGIAYGGGFEIVLNCDLVVASEKAVFGAVETANGLVAIHGALPRMARIAGHQLASEAYLMARNISAKEAYERYGFVNRVVAPPEVLPVAMDMAREIAAASPDAIQSTKRALLLSQKFADVEEVVRQHVICEANSSSKL